MSALYSPAESALRSNAEMMMAVWSFFSAFFPDAVRAELPGILDRRLPRRPRRAAFLASPVAVKCLGRPYFLSDHPRIPKSAFGVLFETPSSRCPHEAKFELASWVPFTRFFLELSMEEEIPGAQHQIYNKSYD